MPPPLAGAPAGAPPPAGVPPPPAEVPVGAQLPPAGVPPPSTEVPMRVPLPPAGVPAGAPPPPAGMPAGVPVLPPQRKFEIRIRDYIGFKVKLLYFIMLHMIGWYTYILTCKSAQIVQVCMWPDNYLPRGGS